MNIAIRSSAVLFVSLLVVACGGGGSGSGSGDAGGGDAGGGDGGGETPSPTPNPPVVHSISGTIAGAMGATVKLSGDASATTTAVDGRYQFAGLADGKYTVAPSLNGYIMIPARTDVVLSGADEQNVDFKASPDSTPTPTHSISGTITGPADAMSVTVTLSGDASASTPAVSGHYEFTGLANGSYTVKPNSSRYSFSPSEAPVVLAGSDMQKIDFKAIENTGVLAGTITGAPSATVTLSGAASATTTAVDGRFQFTGLADGTYYLTPSLPGHYFSPEQRSYTIRDGRGWDGFSFAAGTPHSISGVVSPMGPALSLSIRISSTDTPVPLSADGTFSIPGLKDGSYRLQLDVDSSQVTQCTNLLSPYITVLGSDVSGVTLTPACVQRISGTVSPAQAGVQINLTGAGSTQTSTTTKDSGAYAFDNLPAGSYTVTPAWPTTSGPLHVQLGAGHVTGVDFALDQSKSVILFATSQAYTGGLGFRRGADSSCEFFKPVACSASSGNIHAVLSVDTSDTIALMPKNFGLPTNLPVRRPSGVVIAATWGGTLLATPLEPGRFATYWTGSSASGDLYQAGAGTDPTRNCRKWGDSNSSVYGRVGNGQATTDEWLSASDWACSERFLLLCACW